ncbi:hypothetical protein Tco_0814472 [Tanacetum coccineum]
MGVLLILKKFDFSSLRTSSTPMETNKALTKDEDGEDIDVHLYMSMIRSLMYLTSSRPDIMFSVCACSRFQVQPKVFHLNAVKRIFRYLKGASLDMKSTIGGCQFLGSRLISWQCKKQTVVANSTTEAEYIAASHCCGQVLWIQNQMLDYGYNFMQTKIHVDNESAICVIKNLVYHSKIKHIKTRHHFIRDSYKKRLVEMVKIHTDHNVADLLTKAFDVSRFNFLVASIGKRGQNTKIPQYGGPLIKVSDEAVHKELGDRMERAATTASSLEAEQDSVKTIIEASLRRHLKLEDNGGVTTLPNSEIFKQLALMRYVTDSDKLTFQKGHFSPQWRFLIHTILHCLSPKKTAWEQFSSNIATAIICLVINRTYNFSKLIFDARIKNLENPHKFLMYLRFLQICFNKQRRLLGPHARTYVAHTLTQKLFSNMKRISNGYSGVDILLFPTMISAPKTSPSRITSSPSLSPQHTPVCTLSSLQPPNTQLTPNVEEAVPMPHESPLHSVHSLRRDEGSVSLNELTDLCTSISKKVGALENELQQTKKTYSTAITKVILRMKKLEKDYAEIKEKNSADTEIILEEEQPTELVEDIRSGEKGASEVSTANIVVTTAEVSTAEPEPEKKTKKQLEQEKLGHEEVINKAGQERVVAKDDQAHVIDWIDLAVLRYHALQNRPYSVAEVRKNMCIYLKNQRGLKMSHFKGMSYEEIRPIFERVWDHNQSFVPMDYEDKEKGSKKKAGGSRKKTLARKRACEKADGGSKNYKIFSEMLDDFDRQDGDLEILFQPDEEDEVWRHQHEYNLISWRLLIHVEFIFC